MSLTCENGIISHEFEGNYMTEYGRTICPECGAGNGLGAPFCAACGLTLIRAGMAARPADDDEDEPPRRPVKKPARPAQDAVQKEAPKKKPALRPIDDDDDPPRRPIKKQLRPRDEDDGDPQEKNLRESTGLNLLAPVGGSIWGLASFTCGLLGTVLPVVVAVLYWLWNAQTWLGKLGYVVLGLAVLLGLLALPLGAMSFVFRPKKGNYGGITSYIRAIIGILLGLVGIGLAIGVGVVWVR
jgi:hypothetical protein